MKGFNITEELYYDTEKFIMIAGPCAVEDENQIIETAKFLKKQGVTVLRGGAFKPRTSPDTFQGLGEEGLKLLAKAREVTGLPVVTEVMDIEHIDMVLKYADILQIGSRNSQNFSLLRKLGKTNKPIVLKRGFGNTIEEFVQSSRYISMAGNEKIILVERGIRSFEYSTRFTLDVSSVPVLKERVDYPIIVDPSHPAGKSKYVRPLALAATSAGSDGLMIEVHPNPERALSDASQQLNFEQFEELFTKVKELLPLLDKKLL